MDFFAVIKFPLSYNFQAEEAAVRTAHPDKNQQKELDEMLSSLGVAPVSGD